MQKVTILSLESTIWGGGHVSESSLLQMNYDLLTRTVGRFRNIEMDKLLGELKWKYEKLAKAI